MGQTLNCELEAQSFSELKKYAKFKEIFNKHLMTILTLSGVVLGVILGV